MQSLIVVTCGVLAFAADVCEDTVLLQVKTRKDMPPMGTMPPLPPLDTTAPLPPAADLFDMATSALVPEILPDMPPLDDASLPSLADATLEDLEDPAFMTTVVDQFLQTEFAAGGLTEEDMAGVDVDMVGSLLAAEFTEEFNTAAEPFMEPYEEPQEHHCHWEAKHCDWGPNGLDETTCRFHRNSFDACMAVDACWSTGGDHCWQEWTHGFGVPPCALEYEVEDGFEGPLPAFKTTFDELDHACQAEKFALEELGVEKPWNCEAFDMVGGWLAIDSLACKFYEPGTCNNPDGGFYCDLYDHCGPHIHYPQHPLDYSCVMGWGPCPEPEFTESPGMDDDFTESPGMDDDFTESPGMNDDSAGTLSFVKSLSKMQNARQAARILKASVSRARFPIAQKHFLKEKVRSHIKHLPPTTPGTYPDDMPFDESPGTYPDDMPFVESPGTYPDDMPFVESPGTHPVDMPFNESPGTHPDDMPFDESPGTHPDDDQPTA